MKRLALAALLGVLTACSQTSAQQARRPAPTEAVATVGDAPITLAEVDDKALEQPASNFGSAKLSQALYEARRAALDEIVADRLIDEAAKAQGIDRAALIDKEITSKIPPVSDTDVASWYQANQARLQGAPLEQVRQPIRSYLTQERMQGIRSAYLDTLKAKTSVRVMLDPPRQKVSTASSPARDRRTRRWRWSSSPTFSDRSARGSVRPSTGLSTYGDRIRFVYRAVSAAEPSERAAAAEAAACANEQGKFWPYHDRLFANQRRLSDADLKQHAAALGSTPRNSTLRRLRTSYGGGRQGHQGRRRSRRQRHAGVLHQRPHDQRRSAVRGIQADHRRRARTK